jgi:glutathione S-transferase
MSERLTLYVCNIDDGGPPPHACKRAQRALRAAGHDFDKIVHARGIPFALFTTGRRPELKAISGQEKLPVLRLADGSTISGSAEIIAWAKSNAPQAGASAGSSAGSPTS